VKDIYGKVGALYGPEVTFRLHECDNWYGNFYGFASAQFLSKDGCTIGLNTPTKMYLSPLGLGLKYLVPFCYGDFYVGLGFQPLHLKTVNCSPEVPQTTSKWGFGGVSKLGAYFDLPCNLFMDLFFDYSFVQVKCNTCSPLVVPVTATMNGAILGLGIGYRF